MKVRLWSDCRFLSFGGGGRWLPVGVGLQRARGAAAEASVVGLWAGGGAAAAAVGGMHFGCVVRRFRWYWDKGYAPASSFPVEALNAATSWGAGGRCGGAAP